MATEEAKRKKRKGKTQFLVVRETDGVLQKYYAGPDKAKAREAAEKLLASEKSSDGVLVIRASSITALAADDLAQSLPRDSF